MGDETKPSETSTGPEPEFTVEQLGETIEAHVKKVLAEHVAQNPPVEPRRDEPSPDSREPSNPLIEMIAPHLRPAFQRLGMMSASAEDAAVFYSSNPKAVSHREEVEKATKAMHEQGIPLSRQAIWDWYRGKNLDKFMKEETAEREAAARAAVGASGVGMGAPNLSPEVSSIVSSGRSAHELSDEELDLVMKGKGGASPATF